MGRDKRLAFEGSAEDIGAEVISRAEGDTYGVVLWKRDGEGSRYGTHEYRVDNPDVWYWGHYFGADEEKLAREDFESRASSVTRPRGERKSRREKAYDTDAGDSPDTYGGGKGDPKSFMGDPDNPKKPSTQDPPKDKSSRPGAPKTRKYSAMVDGVPVGAVYAKSPSDAKDLLDKDLKTTHTRRHFHKLWVDGGKKVKAAESASPSEISEADAKEIVSANLWEISDLGFAQVLREVIFDVMPQHPFNWQSIGALIAKYMPEEAAKTLIGTDPSTERD